MRRTLLLMVLACLAAAASASAQTAADSAAIRATALNYIEGWYTGDGDRMASALHPDLVKRIVSPAPGGGSRLGEMSAEELVRATRGRRPAGAPGRREVRILDVFGRAATVRIDADDWVDYLQMARWNGEWKIVNVLWELRP